MATEWKGIVSTDKDKYDVGSVHAELLIDDVVVYTSPPKRCQMNNVGKVEFKAFLEAEKQSYDEWIARNENLSQVLTTFLNE